MNNELWHTKKESCLFKAVFIAYCWLLVIVLITRFSLLALITQNPWWNSKFLPRQYNLIPFHSIMNDVRVGRPFSLNTVGNILMFIPLGIGIRSLLAKKKAFWGAVICCGASLLVEISQFILATGSFDVDDILLNTMGGILGVLAWQLLYLLSAQSIPDTNGLVTRLTLIFPPFLFSFIKNMFFWDVAWLDGFSWLDVLVLVVYFVGVYLLLRKDTPQKQLAVLGGIALVFGLFFYLVFI